MASKASAVWTGSLKEGKGTISTATGVLNNANYSFATRFEGASSGTTPEELTFGMALELLKARAEKMADGAPRIFCGCALSRLDNRNRIQAEFLAEGLALNRLPGSSTQDGPDLLGN